MLLAPNWLELDEVGSTQIVASELVRDNRRDIGVVFAHDQVAGKGRFGREWVSRRGESLTVSIILWNYADWQEPWLLGMMVAVVAARIIGCNVRWPNDLAYGTLKTGGILSELMLAADGSKVPVVGCGINLRQQTFPRDLPHATSVLLSSGRLLDAKDLALAIIDNLRHSGDPKSWSDVQPLWAALDATPGKQYRTPAGEVVTAMKVGEGGVLVYEQHGQLKTLMAADAIFG